MSQMQLPLRRPSLWPAAVIITGISLTVCWAVLLGYGVGYGLLRIIEHAI
jgi:hypothetical protein